MKNFLFANKKSAAVAKGAGIPVTKRRGGRKAFHRSAVYHPAEKPPSLLKKIMHFMLAPFADILEPLYWYGQRAWRRSEHSRLGRAINFIKTRYILMITFLVGSFLGHGVIVYQPRPLVIYSFLPVFAIMAFTRPIMGYVFYLVSVLGMLQEAVWNFPKFYMGSPLLILVLGGWVLNAMVKKESLVEYVHDSSNYPAMGLWLMAALHYTYNVSNFYQSAVQESCMLTYFVCIHIIGRKEGNLKKVLYTLAGVYGFYAYKTLRMAAYYGFGTDYTVTAEIPGRLADNNELAACLNMALPIFYALAMITPAKSKYHMWFKFGLLGMFVMDIAAIIYTRSRGGYTTLAIIAVLISWKFILKESKNKTISIFFLSLILLGAYAAFYEKIMTRVEETIHWETDSSAHNRFLSLATGFNMMYRHPWTGVGLGKAMENFIEYCPVSIEVPTGWGDEDYITLYHPGHALVIHNAYAQVCGETGVPGITLYLSLLFGSIIKMRKLRRVVTKESDYAWAIPVSHALECSLVAFLWSSLFLSNAQLEFMYVLTGCCGSLCYITQGQHRTPAKRRNLIFTALLASMFVHWLYLTVGVRVGLIDRMTM